MSTWYWKTADHAEPFGPITAKELKRLVRSNRLSQDDLVKRQGMKDWIQASALKGLFDLRGSQEEKAIASGSTADSGSLHGSREHQKPYHSTGMYQKGEQKPDAWGATNSGNGFSNAMPYGPPSQMNDPLSKMQFEMAPSFFSFDGRIGRMTYFLQSMGISLAMAILMVIVGFVMVALFGEESAAFMGIIVLLSVAATVILAFPLIKRLHDLNLSAWFYWVSFIPVINILFSLYVLFARGTEGPNQYGPDPR